jgi:hypothetical protein
MNICAMRLEFLLFIRIMNNTSINQTILNEEEQEWILTRRVTRLSDNKEVQIYPMGAERYLASVLLGDQKNSYNIRADIEGKDVLIIPGHGNNSFLLAQAGAKSITVVDKDPVTIAWMKAFKKYYHYRGSNQEVNYPSVGEVFDALTAWYPPLLFLPTKKIESLFNWIIRPNSLRRIYIHYVVSLIQHAIQTKTQGGFELDKNIQFYPGTLEEMSSSKKTYDTAFVPYLLGVENGIEKAEEIVRFIEQLTYLVPKGHILVSPSRDVKEFKIAGRRYFVTTGYPNIQDIPGLNAFFLIEDKYWFHTQGLSVFGSHKLK